MPAGRRFHILADSVPAHLSSTSPAQLPASPDEPWVTGLVEAVDDASGERYPVDLSRVTANWIRARLGVRAEQTLRVLECARIAATESVFAYVLAGIAVELIYGEAK
jgi:hypothetical protein